MAEKIYSINYLILRAIPLTNRMGVYVGINKQYEEIVYVGQGKGFL